MTSTAPTPKGPQEQSLTEKRLQELLAKRADVVAGGVPDRNIQARRVSASAQNVARERTHEKIWVWGGEKAGGFVGARGRNESAQS